MLQLRPSITRAHVQVTRAQARPLTRMRIPAVRAFPSLVASAQAPGQENKALGAEEEGAARGEGGEGAPLLDAKRRGWNAFSSSPEWGSRRLDPEAGARAVRNQVKAPLLSGRAEGRAALALHQRPLGTAPGALLGMHLQGRGQPQSQGR